MLTAFSGTDEMCSDGASDVDLFVKVALGGSSYETSVVDDDPYAYIDETHEFQACESASDDLILEVWDKDDFYVLGTHWPDQLCANPFTVSDWR